MAAPNVQHYKNPLKWGWYYIERSGNAASGLMSKRAAKAMRRDLAGGAGYGLSVAYRNDAPKLKAFRRLGFPLGSVFPEKVIEA